MEGQLVRSPMHFGNSHRSHRTRPLTSRTAPGWQPRPAVIPGRSEQFTNARWSVNDNDTTRGIMRSRCEVSGCQLLYEQEAVRNKGSRATGRSSQVPHSRSLFSTVVRLRANSRRKPLVQTRLRAGHDLAERSPTLCGPPHRTPFAWGARPDEQRQPSGSGRRRRVAAARRVKAQPTGRQASARPKRWRGTRIRSGPVADPTPHGRSGCSCRRSRSPLPFREGRIQTGSGCASGCRAGAGLGSQTVVVRR
ncbi:hypothetical protein M2271_006100 [Streptomyces sp. LBL]|nr:hypothetical protein [Streptomyces sp. LBL]